MAQRKTKKPNEDLVAFAVEARAQRLTYGQLQQQETLLKLKEKPETEKKRKGAKRK